jgi:tight adherence protein C
MTLQLIALLTLLVIAMSSAVWAYVASRPRESVLSRIAGYQIGPTPVLLPGATRVEKFGSSISRYLPEWLVTRPQILKLLQAGYDSEVAPPLFGVARIASAIILPFLSFALVQNAKPLMMTSGIALGLFLGYIAPIAWLDNRSQARQDRIRKGLPDALDLLLVCVEAGVSLDAAILRVGRELALAHPDLAEELVLLNRRQNAGMSRDDALRGLFERTGVQEMRTLASNIAQSERWGTSMSRVLRVTSDIMRRQRKEAAEKRAALASTKMVFPLALMILPALLAIIYGAALINIRQVFSGITR